MRSATEYPSTVNIFCPRPGPLSLQLFGYSFMLCGHSTMGQFGGYVVFG